jgi:hypothetical protein
VKRKFEKLGVTTPMGFFASAGVVAEEDAFEFTREEDQEDQADQADPDAEIDIDGL